MLGTRILFSTDWRTPEKRIFVELVSAGDILAQSDSAKREHSDEVMFVCMNMKATSHVEFSGWLIAKRLMLTTIRIAAKSPINNLV